MLRVYRDGLVGPAPEFPRAIERGIDKYLARSVPLVDDGSDTAQWTPLEPVLQCPG